MADVLPLEVDTTDPQNPVLRRMPAANRVSPTRLPDATTSTKGVAPLGASAPPDIAASGSAGNSSSVASANHTHGHGAQAGGNLHANAQPGGAAGFMSGADKQALDQAVQSATNLASSGAALPAESELGVARGKTGTALELRAIVAQQGLAASIVGESIRISRRPKLWLPRARAAGEQYQRIRCRGRKTAGAVGDNAAAGPNYYPAVLVENHGTSDHLGPFMVYTAVDTTGLPHKFHRRLRGSSLADASVIKGYEWGHDVAAGDARYGHRFVWELGGEAENVGWFDAFWDFRVEINPTAGNFAGPNLMSLLGPELGATWSGARTWRARVELVVTGANSCEVHGVWTLFSSTGAVLRTWERSAKLSNAHDWLTTAARLQLRWRVERDLANRANTFDWANQGERQGANVLRLHVDDYGFEPIGFREE